MEAAWFLQCLSIVIDGELERNTGKYRPLASGLSRQFVFNEFRRGGHKARMWLRKKDHLMSGEEKRTDFRTLEFWGDVALIQPIANKTLYL